VTPIVEFIGGILDRFNNLSDGVKKAIVVLTVAIGAIGPIALMTFGLLANGLANIVKGALVLRNGYLRLTGQTQILGEQTEYLTMEQIDAAAASHSLDQSHARLTQTFTAESSAVAQLISAYQQATVAAAKFAAINPGMMRAPSAPTKRAKGKPVVVGGSGNQDTELALLTPGETVIPADMSKQYAALINGMIAGNIPGYRLGRSSSGMFETSIGKSKEDIGLYKAPSAIKPQTIANMWTTYEAEVEAMTKAAEEFLIESGFSAEQITKKINQLVQKQASHITEQIQQIQIAGETVDVKEWNASNLITDFGGINNYLNSIHKVTETLDEQEISRLAQELDMSIDEFKTELKMLTDGIHPTTRKGGSVLGAIAEKGSTSKDTTLAYQSKSVAAGMKTRLTGDFYETVSDRAYDPTKDIKSLEQVEAKVLKLKTQVLNSFNISDEVASLSGKNAQSLNAAWSQLSIQAKERLIALSGDVNAFTAALMQEAKDAGIAGFEVGKSATIGIAKGAKTASPSKDTIKTGQDIGRGLEIGMDSMQDDVAMSGQELGSSAVGGTQNGARQRRLGTSPGGTVGPGGTINPINVGISPAMKDAIDKEVTARKTSAERIDSMNKGLMAGTFALTSLAGAGSMASGPIGNLSQQVMKYSGLLFALMSVTQLLTQAKFAELVATRASAAAGLMKGLGKDAVGKQIGAKVSSLFTKGGGLAGFGKNLLTAGKLLLRFLGPIGLVTTGLIGLYSITKMINAQREKERQKLEAFSDVITVSTDKLKFLSEQFNFVPVKGSLETFGKDLERTSTVVRSAREELKASEGFQETYGQNIEQVRGMSDQQAETALSFMGLDLISQGMAKEQVQLLIDTIKEEAGKKDLKFDFKKLTFDEKGLKGLNSQFDTSIKEFANTAKNGFEKVFQQVAVGEGRGARLQIVERLVPNAEAKAAIKNAGALIGSYAESLNRLVTSGSIEAEEFTKVTDNMFASIAESAPDASLQIRIFNATLNAIDPALAKTVKGVKDLKDNQLLLKSAIAGVSANLIANAALAFRTAEGLNKVAEANLKAFGVKDVNVDQAKARGTADGNAITARKLLNDAIKESIEIQKELNKVQGTVGGAGGGKEDTPFELAIKQLVNQRKELENTKNAYKVLTAAGIDSATATKFAEDSVIALGLATGNIDLTRIKEFIAKMKELEQLSRSEAIANFLKEINEENTLKQSFAEIVPDFQKLGATAEDIETVLNNPKLMQSFVDKSATTAENTKRMKDYLDAIRTGEAVDLKFDLIINPNKAAEELKRKADELFGFLERTAQREYKPKIIDKEKEVKNAQDAVDEIQLKIDNIQKNIDLEQRKLETGITRTIEQYQEQVSDLQRTIEMQFDRPIEAIQNEISALERGIELDFERPLSALQETSSDLSNDLTLMDKQAESINEKYDAQAKALEDVSNINQRILGQQKQQISLADALTQGDISAAAQMAQESRASSAEASSANAQNTLQAARQLELDRLRNAAGLTRKQIEEAQFRIGQQTFAIEEQREAVQARIQIKQDQIFALEKARQTTLTQIKGIEDSIYILEEQREAVLLTYSWI
jgi:hypothetical protein